MVNTGAVATVIFSDFASLPVGLTLKAAKRHVY